MDGRFDADTLEVRDMFGDMWKELSDNREKWGCKFRIRFTPVQFFRLLIVVYSHWQNWYPALYRCGEHQQRGVDLLLEKPRGPPSFCSSGSPPERLPMVYEGQASFDWYHARDVCCAGRELGDYLPQLRAIWIR